MIFEYYYNHLILSTLGSLSSNQIMTRSKIFISLHVTVGSMCRVQHLLRVSSTGASIVVKSPVFILLRLSVTQIFRTPINHIRWKKARLQSLIFKLYQQIQYCNTVHFRVATSIFLLSTSIRFFILQKHKIGRKASIPLQLEKYFSELNNSITHESTVAIMLYRYCGVLNVDQLIYTCNYVLLWPLQL